MGVSGRVRNRAGKKGPIFQPPVQKQKRKKNADLEVAPHLQGDALGRLQGGRRGARQDEAARDGQVEGIVGGLGREERGREE